MGREVTLVSLDDQYNASLVPQLATTLLNASDFMAFIGCYGSPTTTAILPILEKFQVANVAPVTGSAAFRIQFAPQLVHLRAGYNDENFAMLNYLLVEVRVKRIGILYQADSFGIPARDGIVEALSYLGLTSTRQQSYNKDTDNVAAHDFVADAKQWAESRTQAIIMYGIGDWVLNTIQATKALYRSLGLSIAFVTCSFMGTALNLGLAAAGTDSTNVFMTQVYPHPESSTLLPTQYRTALQSLEGPAAQLEYLSLEGYAAARFAVQVLKRMTNFTRSQFLNTVNVVRMTDVGDQLAGPFSSSCPDTSLTLSGARSSLCNCLQGFRHVELTAITANYSNAPIHTLQYPISECYATPSSSLQSPVIYAQVWPSGNPWAAARVREFNRGVSYVTSTRPVRFVNASFGSSVNASQLLASLVDGALVAAVAGSVNVPDVPMSFPVLATLQSPAVLAASYTESTLHLLPTLQQEIYSWVEFLVQQSGFAYQCTIHVLYPSGYDPTVVQLVQQSCYHFVGERRSQVTSSVFTGGFSLSSAVASPLPAAGSQLFIFGLQPQSDLPALVEVAKHFDGWQIFTPFMDVAMHWDTMDPCATTACDSALLARLHFATSLPSWKTANSTLVRDVMAAANSSNITALEVLGFVVQTLLLDLLRRSSEVDPSSILKDWYYTAVHTVDDMAFGVYSNTNCSSGNCLCNKGAQTLAVYRMGPFLQGAGPTSAAQAVSCNLDYTVPVCILDTDCQLYGDVGATCVKVEGFAQCSCSVSFTGSTCVGKPAAAADVLPTIIGAVVGGGGGAVLLALMCWCLLAYGRRSHSNAPKDPAKPFCIAFTDIQSSTHLWATIPEVMAVALSLHHELIRKQIAAHKCYEVKTIGDSFMCAAKTPIQALRFALAVQTELMKYPWPTTIESVYQQQLALEDSAAKRALWNGLRVRVGIHYGLGDIILDPVSRSYDYYGTVVNAAARIESLCHGGQVAVSEAVYQEVSQAVADVQWTSLGQHTLRGLAEPVHLYQVLPVALAARQFPPLRAREEVAGPMQYDVVDSTATDGIGDDLRKGSSSESRYSQDTSLFADGRWAEKHPLVLQGQVTADEVRRHHAIILTALQTLFSMQTARFQQDTLKVLCGKLQVRNYGCDARTLQRTLHGLIQRLLPATLARCEPSTTSPLTPGLSLFRPLSFADNPMSSHSVSLRPLPQPLPAPMQPIDL
eukprot:GGOE01012952.1.p1 GENE.GGOE01012952.1~~GGOE01012952.1.p1  ORF type:complete len:1267 (+),score=400.20 GGOE01012952.1:203-3802(+)